MSTSLLRTTPQGERKAIQGIERAGVRAWTPTEDRVKRAYRYSKKKRVVTVPLAPGYIIVETDSPHRLVHEVEQVAGVIGSLREPDVARLRGMADIAADPTKPSKVVHSKTLAVGQAIVVREGPFRELHAKIKEIIGADAMIMLDIFGRPTPATMPLEWLDPL